jgi:predicted dehydrogenase
MSTKVKIGLYGTEGHQIQDLMEHHPLGEIVAMADCQSEKIPEYLLKGDVRVHDSLEALLADEAVQLISFCSPHKDAQGEHVIQCLEAGKHAYAEKPCCMSEAVLDRILETAKRTGLRFHEMAGTAWEAPYAKIREVVASGAIGEVIQVLAQKSYPWADWRPGDERVDGGLALQVGVYPVRFVEHVAGVKVKSMQLRETKLGNTVEGSECRRAVSYMMELENGGLASAVANYCCPGSPSWPTWGYEALRIFGDKGFVECIDGGRVAQLVVEGELPQALDCQDERTPFLNLVLQEIQTGETCIPFTPEEETNPTRWVIRAKYGN